MDRDFPVDQIFLSTRISFLTKEIVELNKLAGESLDVIVNDKVIARGEAVVINDKFGVRLTEVISPNERALQLRD